MPPSETTPDSHHHSTNEVAQCVHHIEHQIQHLTNVLHHIEHRLDGLATCAHLENLLANLRKDMQARFDLLLKDTGDIIAQIDEMNTLLTTVAEQETTLGTSIQTVVDFLKANPNPTPTDLTAQLASLQAISDTLIASNASTLANLPPTPPAGGRRP